MSSIASNPSEKLPCNSSQIKGRINNARELNKLTAITHLFHYVPPVFMYENCVDVLDRFLNNEDLFVVAIIDANNCPVGLVDRARIIQLFIHPLARKYYQKRAISEFMDVAPVIVDADSSIDELVQRLITTEVQQQVNGFIITKNGLYLGIGTANSLLREIFNSRQGNLYSLAYYDSLTGLPNRLLFHDRLHQACRNANRDSIAFALIFVDIDRFKEINDSYGHSFGDLLLKSVGERLVASLRESDTVARLAGDEFVIILHNTKDITDVTKVCSLIIDKLHQPINIHDHALQLSASLGIAICPQHDQTPVGLMHKADSAMYDAKRAGRNRYAIYSERLSKPLLERVSLARHLKKALDNQELMLFYQPVVRLSTNQVVGVEALLRWQHPEFGLIFPSKFLSIAEEIGIIDAIGEWVLREACKQHCSWIEQGLPPIRISINISAKQYEHKNFCDTVRKIIDETGIDPKFVELEPTEKMLMTCAEKAIVTLSELRKIGVKISIDNFGVGYSSLSYLRHFQIDRIKIDNSFVRNIQTNAANEAIVRAIVMLGVNLDLDIVAEGVETTGELECIRGCSCQYVQGHIFSRPVPPADLEYWYQRRLIPAQCSQ